MSPTANLVADDGSITDPYRNFITVSRYARWREDDQRRETWVETVTRYVEFFRSHLVDNYGYDRDDGVFEQVREAILHHEVMPSMRALMTAGPALERSHVAGYNCFRGTECVITAYGVKTFADMAKVGWTDVLNAKGEWVHADIKEFGAQPLQQVTFRPGHQSRTALRHQVDVTPDHRWITTNRGEVTDLRIGDEVAFVGARYRHMDRAGWTAGFGFGDGTINQRGRAQLRLCGEKNQHLDFMTYDSSHRPNVTTPPSYNGDHMLIWPAGVFATWKTLPTTYSSSWIAAWIHGYIAADGSDKGGGLYELSSQDAQAIEFVKKWAAYAGLMVVGHNIMSNVETNYGPRSAPLHKLTLREEGVFRVTNIEDLEVEETVYCAVVDDGHEFVLANGIHTGNCSFIAVDDQRAFDEAMFILLNGTGVGFSVERRHVDKLPIVSDRIVDVDKIIVPEDSKEGWVQSFRDLLTLLWQGEVPTWDLSLVRPAGAKLKVFGGRASGPGPLDQLFRFATDMITAAAGRRLTSLECHDLFCKIGDVVVSGGVRRSALISLSDLNDYDMSIAKSGSWWEQFGHRRLANNSAVYESKPSIVQFLREWGNLIQSQSGERGIYNLAGARDHATRQGRDGSKIEGTNPCGEILLRDQQFCNLSEVIARPEDTEDSLARKVKLAAIIGTWQSTLTDFKHLRSAWRTNCEEERLLGVSLTGIYGNQLLNDPNDPDLPQRLHELREHAHQGNRIEADRLGIAHSTAVTCVKPSGTVSQLTGVSSGIHPWHSSYYIRTVRGSNTDPLSRMLTDYQVPSEPDLMNPEQTTVFSFPVKAPAGAVTRDRVTALDHLKLWSIFRANFTDHNPSITISVHDHEWLAVGAWVFDNWDDVGGVSFLPYAESCYQQAPYTECDEATYQTVLDQMPQIQWSDLRFYESSDGTSGSQELACSAGACEVVDISV